jgi:hypothetical protein
MADISCSNASPANSPPPISAETLEQVFVTLFDRGWCSMAFAPDQDIRIIIPQLRPGLADPMSSVELELVSPKNSSQGRPETMSAEFGMGSFPLHTERAHWPIPPRFLIFRSVGRVSDRPTTLLDSYRLDLDEELAQELFQRPWIVRYGEICFESPVLRTVSSGRGRWQIRYDHCCMTPSYGVMEDLGSQLESALAATELEQHYWEPGMVLIVDNWRVLHGRGTSTEADFGRSLERIVVP